MQKSQRSGSPQGGYFKNFRYLLLGFEVGVICIVGTQRGEMVSANSVQWVQGKEFSPT